MTPETRSGLQSYEPLPEGRWAALDTLACAAARLVGVPIGLVNLVRPDELLTLAGQGAPLGPSPLEPSFCRHVSDSGTQQVVADTLGDPRFAASPYVIGPPHVRFYAGSPLRTASGEVLGTLCVMGPEPRALDDDQRALLQVLADQAMAQLELHRQVAAQQGALERLEASERRYRLLAHNATDIVSRHGADGSVLWVSPSLQRVLGHDPEAETADAALGRVHPDDAALFTRALQELPRSGAASTVTARVRHADGRWVWLETTLSCLRDEAGALLEVYSAARDVTARVEATERLADTEQRYRALVEQTPDAILVHDGVHVTFANASAVRLLRAPSREDLVGVPVLRLVTPEEGDGAGQPSNQAADGAEVRRRVRRLDGSCVVVDVTDSRVDLGGSVGVQVVLRDATAAVEAERVVRESREQDRMLFEQSPVALAQTDAAGRLLRVNEAFARMLGRGEQELTGRTMRELAVEPGDVGLAAQAAAGDDRPVVSRVHTHPDGRQVQTTATATVLRDDDGAVRGLVATLVDMTERNAAQAALEAMVGELREARDDARGRSELLEAVLETIDVGVVVCDARGRMVLSNRATQLFHGRPHGEAGELGAWLGHLDLRAEDGITPLDPEQVPLHRALVDGEVHDAHVTIVPVSGPARLVRCDGRALRGPDGALAGAVVAMKDVTELRASEQRFRAAFLHGPTPMARLDPDGTVREVNPALVRFLGHPALDSRLQHLVHPDDVAELDRALAGATDRPVEVRVRRSDGADVWCELATSRGTAPQDGPYVLVQLVDVHARKLNELALEQAAEVDPLTGLGNRSVLDRELRALLDPVVGSGGCVLFLDLDDFKAVNDRLGHDAGDAVLAETGRRVREALRPADTAVRLGGDEFVVVCPVADGPKEAAAVGAHLVRRLERLLAQPVRYAGQAVPAAASVGAAVGVPGQDPARVLALADAAMYARKRVRRAGEPSLRLASAAPVVPR